MNHPEPVLLKGAHGEFMRWIDKLAKRPFTTKVVANFVFEIEETIHEIEKHPNRYPLEGYKDYRRAGPTRIHEFKIIYVVREGRILIVAIAHPGRRPRYWAMRKLKVKHAAEARPFYAPPQTPLKRESPCLLLFRKRQHGHRVVRSSETLPLRECSRPRRSEGGRAWLLEEPKSSIEYLEASSRAVP